MSADQTLANPAKSANQGVHRGSGSRYAALDGVRAFAVLPVVVAHAKVSWLHAGGGAGVEVFFVLSGFIITYLLLAEHEQTGEVALRRFWLRRVLRLAPALLTLIVAVDALMLLGSSFSNDPAFVQTLRATPSVMLYFANWMVVSTQSGYLGWFGPLWSLSVEEQFYLVWPIVLVLALRYSRPRLALCVCAASGVMVCTAWRAAAFDASNMYSTFATQFHLDMLLLGVLLATLLRSRHQSWVQLWSRWLVWPSLAYVVAIWFVMPPFDDPEHVLLIRSYYSLGLPLLGLSSVAIIGYLMTSPASRLAKFFSTRPFTSTGRISYGIYLWHYPIILGLRHFETLNPNEVLMIALVTTYVVAGASWVLIEKPLNRHFHRRLLWQEGKWQSDGPNARVRHV
jgi:peptidoglycan/LPS O-acetylase OafA/YrhL